MMFMSMIQNTTNRLTGLFSGMDTDALVKAMLSGQQAKIDRMSQTKTKAEWKKDAFTDFNNTLRQFREDFGSILGKNSMVTKASFVSFQVSMNVTTSAFSVKGTSGAKAGDYSLRIDQIATAASMTTGKLTGIEGGYSASVISSTSVSSLTSLQGGLFQGADGDGDFSFEINGESFTFNMEDSLKTIMDKVNASKANVTMSYSQVTDSITITSKTTGALKGETMAGEPPVKPPDFRAKPDADDYLGEDDPRYKADMEAWTAENAEYQENIIKPYQEKLNEYNAKKAVYDSDQKKNITFDDTSGFLAHLGFGSVTLGQNARVSINGSAVAEYESNNVTLDGVEYTFKQATAGVKYDFTLTQDTKSSVDRVKGFVEELNKIVKKLFDAYYEKKDYKHTPLTSSMKEQMTEKEAEEWDNLAKSGLMARDAKLGSLLSGLRDMLTKELGGAGKLSDIGIKSSPYRVGESWSFELDEEALTKALEKDPDAVYNLFAASEKSDPSGGGMVTRINAMFDNFVAQTKSTDISTLNTNLQDYTKRIQEMEDKMYTMSERYYLQYAQLETALGKMQAQTDQMASLFGVTSA